MYKVVAPAVLVLAVAGCASEGPASISTPRAGETRVPRDEVIANHTNTIIKATFSNGDRSESVFGADNSVKATYRWRDGSESDEGSWTLNEEGVLCFTWKKKWDKSCWVDYKSGDQYVGYEQGGKKRRVTFTVAPRA